MSNKFKPPKEKPKKPAKPVEPRITSVFDDGPGEVVVVRKVKR